MHLLAISGLHVGILAGIVHLFCRLLKLQGGSRTLILVGTVLAYMVLTNQRPPVLRAAMLFTIGIAGLLYGRRSSGYHTLSLCAALLLLARPADLFDIGAQLSFVAVLAIIWASQTLIPLLRRHQNDPLAMEPSLRLKPLRTAIRVAGESYVLTTAIWLITLPLAAYHFQLLAPVGIIANVLLMPVVALMLAAGYLTLAVGLIVPPAAPIPGTLFESLLILLETVAHYAAEIPLGHLRVAPPSLWWVTGTYLLLAVMIGLLGGTTLRRWSLHALGAWVILGLGLAFVPVPTAGGLRCSFLSVGHGSAVLLELPNGRTVLYDAGSFANARRAEQVVQSVLWEHNRHRLDAIIISHADIDHFNAVGPLVRSVPVGSVLTASPFLDVSQPAVLDTLRALQEVEIPLQIIDAGDRILCDPAVTIDVLHPPETFDSPHDNASSIVLLISYAGRRLLLTADIEAEGLQQLLATPPTDCDVLMSPHHGSLAANPPRLASWATPEYVIASSGHRTNANALQDRYQPASVLSTHEHGCVTITVTPGGDLHLTTFR